jgi:hypothetical protein
VELLTGDRPFSRAGAPENRVILPLAHTEKQCGDAKYIDGLSTVLERETAGHV